MFWLIFKNLLLQHLCIWLWGYYFPDKLYGLDKTVYKRKRKFYRRTNFMMYDFTNEEGVSCEALIMWDKFQYYRIECNSSKTELHFVNFYN